MTGGLVLAGKPRTERGMTTAEYAVGTVATVSFVGVLIAIFNNPDFQRLLWEIVKAIVAAILRAIAGS